MSFVYLIFKCIIYQIFIVRIKNTGRFHLKYHRHSQSHLGNIKQKLYCRVSKLYFVYFRWSAMHQENLNAVSSYAISRLKVRCRIVCTYRVRLYTNIYCVWQYTIYEGNKSFVASGLLSMQNRLWLTKYIWY